MGPAGMASVLMVRRLIPPPAGSALQLVVFLC
jgi:hypothetical protein